MESDIQRHFSEIEEVHYDSDETYCELAETEIEKNKISENSIFHKNTFQKNYFPSPCKSNTNEHSGKQSNNFEINFSPENRFQVLKEQVNGSITQKQSIKKKFSDDSNITQCPTETSKKKNITRVRENKKKVVKVLVNKPAHHTRSKSNKNSISNSENIIKYNLRSHSCSQNYSTETCVYRNKRGIYTIHPIDLNEENDGVEPFSSDSVRIDADFEHADNLKTQINRSIIRKNSPFKSKSKNNLKSQKPSENHTEVNSKYWLRNRKSGEIIPATKCEQLMQKDVAKNETVKPLKVGKNRNSIKNHVDSEKFLPSENILPHQDQGFFGIASNRNEKLHTNSVQENNLKSLKQIKMFSTELKTEIEKKEISKNCKTVDCQRLRKKHVMRKRNKNQTSLESEYVVLETLKMSKKITKSDLKNKRAKQNQKNLREKLPIERQKFSRIKNSTDDLSESLNKSSQGEDIIELVASGELPEISPHFIENSTDLSESLNKSSHVEDIIELVVSGELPEISPHLEKPVETGNTKDFCGNKNMSDFHNINLAPSQGVNNEEDNELVASGELPEISPDLENPVETGNLNEFGLFINNENISNFHNINLVPSRRVDKKNLNLNKRYSDQKSKYTNKFEFLNLIPNEISNPSFEEDSFKIWRYIKKYQDEPEIENAVKNKNLRKVDSRVDDFINSNNIPDPWDDVECLTQYFDYSLSLTSKSNFGNHERRSGNIRKIDNTEFNDLCDGFNNFLIFENNNNEFDDRQINRNSNLFDQNNNVSQTDHIQINRNINSEAKVKQNTFFGNSQPLNNKKGRCLFNEEVDQNNLFKTEDVHTQNSVNEMKISPEKSAIPIPSQENLDSNTQSLNTTLTIRSLIYKIKFIDITPPYYVPADSKSAELIDGEFDVWE